MALATTSVFSEPIRETVAGLRRLIENDSTETLKGVIDEITEAVDRVVAEGEVRQMVRYRERLHRLTKGIREYDSVPAGAYALGAMDTASRQLALARTRALGRRAAERYEQESVGVREKVYGLLAQAARPRDIADHLGCDPSQVSRAISELIDAGQIAESAPPAGAPEDRRAHWYQQATTTPTPGRSVYHR